MTSFGKKVEEYRERLGIKQNALAKRVGLTASHLNRIEKETRKAPQVEVVLAMVKALYLNPEEAIEFVELAGYSPQVIHLDGALAATQVVPAQQLPSATGTGEEVLPQILTLLQALTGAVTQFTAIVAQLQAQLVALQQPNTATPTLSDVSQQDPGGEGDKSPVEPTPGKAPFLIVRKTPEEDLAEGVREVERSKESEVVIEWDKRIWPARTNAQIEKWDKYWTRIYEEEGSLLVVMKGLQGMTLDKNHYRARLQPLLKQKETGQLLINILDRLDQRRKFFEEQVKTYVFRHIMPIGALDWYMQTGYSRIDDYGLILGGLPAPEHQRVADIRHIISLLKDKKFKKYHLGLLTGKRSEQPIYDTSFWELKGDHGLILENLANGERNAINTDQLLKNWFGDYFETLWRSEGMITDRDEVITKLTWYADEAERLIQIPAMS